MDENTQSNQQPTPQADLKTLDRLVGKWRMTGGLEGDLTYSWIHDGFFLKQESVITQDGLTVTGTEIIGHLHSIDGKESKDIKSRLYDSMGSTYDYTYEIKDDVFMIWTGERDSPSYYEAKFSEDGNTITGKWVFPDGGFDLIMTRVTE